MGCGTPTAAVTLGSGTYELYGLVRCAATSSTTINSWQYTFSTSNGTGTGTAPAYGFTPSWGKGSFGALGTGNGIVNFASAGVTALQFPTNVFDVSGPTTLFLDPRIDFTGIAFPITEYIYAKYLHP